MLRQTFALIRQDDIAHNIRELRRAAGTPVMAVVKADAYGHGMHHVVSTALKQGVNWLAVATPDEALDLKENGCEAHILVLSPVLKEALPQLVENRISICVCELEQLELLEQCGKHMGLDALVHVKVDTGMGRVGIRSMEEFIPMLAFFKEAKHVKFEGIFTHFATADETDKTFTFEQAARFRAFCESAQAAGFHPLRHAANSAATIELPDTHFDLCRIGISLYGYMPSKEVSPKGVELRPALSLYSYISYLKTIHAGDSVSYGRRYTATEDRVIATVPIGYADGYRRELTNCGSAIIRGKKVPLVGTVCMDQVMFDVTGTGAQEGDRVVLIGEEGEERITADDLAACCGTISYEILTGFTKRVARVYK